LEKGTEKTKSVVLLEKEQQKHKCCSFGKGTTKIKIVVPLEKEQQKHKCRSFGKGTTKMKSAEVMFHSEMNNKT